MEAVEFVELVETVWERWIVSRKWGDTVKLIETLKSRTEALKVAEVAKLFGVTPQHIYRMAANGGIPSFRISGSVRFDPDDVAAWLKEKQAPAAASRRIGSARVAA
jgi:excisionase family DNA binding protein